MVPPDANDAGSNREPDWLLSKTQDVPGSQPSAEESATHPSQIGRYPVERRLGEGSFGLVFLARDDQLQRYVAIKVPHARYFRAPEDAETYLTEAQLLARLDHRHILPIYDVGRTDSHGCFLVTKYIDGSSLVDWMRGSDRPDFRWAAELVSHIAEALHHAHTAGLVHRDVKPSNILLDREGRPYLSDFGLAVREDDIGSAAGFAGTPAYMSPEQARREGHLVDGRSDIYSLGVILYELLAGRRPFTADSTGELLQRIARQDVRPPRQCDDRIPRELERICLHALARRTSDRYTTARDMAEDLRQFLLDTFASGTDRLSSPTAGRSDVDSRPPGSSMPRVESGRRSATDRLDSVDPIAVVPKGLHSFDEHDADFFLHLVPGPRDREGWPAPLRFWKKRIEEAAGETTFRVGVLFGPSGSGKSSLVRAGLLPRLTPHITRLYVAATPGRDSTERHLRSELARLFPEAEPDLSLVDVLRAIRQGRFPPRGDKVLIVLDQFEQWLHSGSVEGSRLVDALRQCDGERLQCLLLVRDDFWMAASRCLEALDLPLQEGINTASVDLFDREHAERVLHAFGRAYGRHPAAGEPGSSEPDAGLPSARREYREFLRRAVAELAEDDYVVCIRIALFAQLMRHKTWSAATLDSLGGVEGVGVRFLDETFSSPGARPEYRRHRDAARRVLAALLPDPHVDFRRHGLPAARLQQVSGYGNTGEFEDLLRRLDQELRLVTLVEGDGRTWHEESSSAKSLRGTTVDPDVSHGSTYILSHDYLVPSIREWIDRRQRETRRGRAEARLADAASWWRAAPSRRRLPTLFEYLNYRVYTRAGTWTSAQNAFMGRAGRFHVSRLSLAIALAALLLVTGMFVGRRVREGRQELQLTERARGVVQALKVAELEEMTGLLAQFSRQEEAAVPLAREQWRQIAEGHPARLRLAFALMPSATPAEERLYIQEIVNQTMETAAPEQLPWIAARLGQVEGAHGEPLWAELQQSSTGDRLLRAACLLAHSDADQTRWAESVNRVAESLVRVRPAHLPSWKEALAPMRSSLAPILLQILEDSERSSAERQLAADVLLDYLEDQPRLACRAAVAAPPSSFEYFLQLLAREPAASSEGLRDILNGSVRVDWPGSDASATGQEIDETVVTVIESRSGWISHTHALAPRIELTEFDSTAAVLDRHGYRPLRLRPYMWNHEVMLAVTWVRDDRPWQWATGPASLLRERNLELTEGGYEPVDVATLPAARPDADSAPSNSTTEPRTPGQYAVLWVQPDHEGPLNRLVIGLTAEEHQATVAAWRREGWALPVAFEVRGEDATARISSVMSPGIAVDLLSDATDPGVPGEARYPGLTLRDLRFKPEDDASGGVRFPEALYCESDRWETELVVGTEDDFGERIGKLVASQYRPLVLECVEREDGAIQVASIWHRPLIDQGVLTTNARRQAVAATALLRLGFGEPCWRSLRHAVSDDRLDVAIRRRSFLIHEFAPRGVPASQLAERFFQEPDVSARRALLLSLGQYPSADILPDRIREEMLQAVPSIALRERDPGLRAAAAWLQTRWRLTEIRLGQETAPGSETPADPVGRRWYRTNEGHDMVVLEPGTLRVGSSPATDDRRDRDEFMHSVTLTRRFAIAAHEVTRAQFERFYDATGDAADIGSDPVASRCMPTPDCPIVAVTWYEAAAYCNWLSDRDGIPFDQWCYQRNEDFRFGPGMRASPGYLDRTGYRLPAQAEWEYACRAGASTARYYGSSDDLLSSYAWSRMNGDDVGHPVGLLKPNDFGLFDMHGNVWEWCHDAASSAYVGPGMLPSELVEDAAPVLTGFGRVLMSGSYGMEPVAVQTADRAVNMPNARNPFYGFRPVRTLPASAASIE